MVPRLEGRRRLGPRGAGPGLPPLTRPAHLLIFVVRLSVPGSLPSLRAPHLPSLLAPAHECSVAQPWLGCVAQAVRNQMTSLPWAAWRVGVTRDSSAMRGHASLVETGPFAGAPWPGVRAVGTTLGSTGRLGTRALGWTASLEARGWGQCCVGQGGNGVKASGRGRAADGSSVCMGQWWSVGRVRGWGRVQWDRTVPCSSAGRTSTTMYTNVRRAAGTVGTDGRRAAFPGALHKVLLLLE